MWKGAIGVVLVAACGGGAGEAADAASGADASGADAGVDARGIVDAGPTTSASWNAADGILPSATCVPFVLNTSVVGGAGPPLADGALVFTSAVASETVYYSHEAEVLSIIRPVTVKATLRVDTSVSDRDSRAFGGVLVRLGDADRDAILQIGEGVVSLVGSAAEPPLATALVATTDAFHTYRLVVDPTTFAIEVFYDGTSILTGTAALAGADVVDRIYWGDLSGFASGSMRWESVSHDALAPVVCP